MKHLPLVILWTGRTDFSQAAADIKPRSCKRVAQVYDKMEPQRFFNQLITLIFEPLSTVLLSQRKKNNKC